MKKVILAVFGVVLTAGLVYAASELSKNSGNKSYAWRYKMIVTVKTPEGEIVGSAVREMGNSAESFYIPDVGNPADVRGEAVAVDMGKRGVLFALISHQSDLEFYNAFPEPGDIGNSTPEGIKHYASLPIGTKGILNPTNPPGYPKLVTFTDMDDPKSVTLAQVWKRNDRGYFYLEEDRMEKLFGDGVKLKDITLEITDEPLTESDIRELIPSFDKESGFWEWRKGLKYTDPRKISGSNFKRGK